MRMQKQCTSMGMATVTGTRALCCRCLGREEKLPETEEILVCVKYSKLSAK